MSLPTVRADKLLKPSEVVSYLLTEEIQVVGYHGLCREGWTAEWVLWFDVAQVPSGPETEILWPL